MSIGNWNNLSFIVQGDIAYSLSMSSISSSYIDLRLIGYSEKWNKFDIAFEYQDCESLIWLDDASIIATNAEYLIGNKLYGLSASKYGTTNIVRWKYVDNNFLLGNQINVRIRILPRIRSFIDSTQFYSVIESYGDNKSDVETGSASRKCFATNQSGQFICSNGHDITIYDNLSDITYVYQKTGFGSIAYAKQIASGDYLACDYSAGIIYQLNESLSIVIRQLSISTPFFIDYSEENETILVCTRIWDGVRHKIREYSWSSTDYGTLLWECLENTNDPTSATYSNISYDEIVISDYSNNRIILLDRSLGTVKYISRYKLGQNDTSVGETSNFNNPFRAYKLYDGNICVIEKDGRIVDFEVLASSSSSSSSSSSLEYSSSSSSSSSSLEYSSSSSSSSSLEYSSSSSSSIEYSSSSSSSSSVEYSSSSSSSSSIEYSSSSSSVGTSSSSISSLGTSSSSISSLGTSSSSISSLGTSSSSISSLGTSSSSISSLGTSSSSSSSSFDSSSSSSAPVYATGGEISYADGYKIHTFKTVGSDTFQVFNGSLNCNVLIVAGGGGGGSDNGAGGGGGEVKEITSSAISGSNNVVVGQGGAGGVYAVAPYVGTNGDPSSFGAISTAGGGGGGNWSTNGLNGGNGGGGGATDGGPTVGGTGVNYDGGVGRYPRVSGGGGGAGAKGEDGDEVTPKGGDGGIGYLCSISGSPVYYGAGGGGGGDSNGYSGPPSAPGVGGETGGGDATSGLVTGESATANTGSGGGGGGGQCYVGGASGGAGGSGIVIIRYSWTESSSSSSIDSSSSSSSAPVYATGGEISYADGYKIHSFKTVGDDEFQVFNGSLNCDILVVAGGGSGGGGNYLSGGGGGGGIIAISNHIVTGENIIAVGEGGTVGAINASGNSGGNSSFKTNVAYGGGGGAVQSATASDGGSGGGSGNNNSPDAYGHGYEGQGHDGGSAVTAGPAYSAAGGGGAGEKGADGTNTTGGKGGDGLQWVDGNWYGGGGGGSSFGAGGGVGGDGGQGGGGAGSTGDATSGQANTGGGGGGAERLGTSFGGAGGSGIVIVRYSWTESSSSSSL